MKRRVFKPRNQKASSASESDSAKCPLPYDRQHSVWAAAPILLPGLLANSPGISLGGAATLIGLALIGMLASQWPQEILRRFRQKHTRASQERHGDG